jgi:hypothetical protein
MTLTLQLLNNPANILPATILDLPSCFFILGVIFLFACIGTLVFAVIARAVEWLIQR